MHPLLSAGAGVESPTKFPKKRGGGYRISILREGLLGKRG